MNSLFPTNEFIDPERLDNKRIIEMQREKNELMLNHLRDKLKNHQALFISGNTPSLKNSREIGQIPTKLSVCHKSLLFKDNGIWRCSKCNNAAQRLTKPILRYSKPVEAFMLEKKSFFLNPKNIEIWNSMIKDKQYPLRIGFYFIRDRKALFDYGNAQHIILDMMTANPKENYKGWIPDDNALYVMEEALGFHHDSNNPGVVITLISEEIINIKNIIYTL